MKQKKTEITKKANQLQKQFQIIFLSTKHAFISDLLYISPQRQIGCCFFGQLAQQSQMGGGRQSGDFKSKQSQKTHKPKQCLEKDESSNGIRNKPEPRGHCPISLFLSSSLREIKEPDSGLFQSHPSPKITVLTTNSIVSRAFIIMTNIPTGS